MKELTGGLGLDVAVDLYGSNRWLDVSCSISDVMPLEDVHGGVDRLAIKDGGPIRLVVAP